MEPAHVQGFDASAMRAHHTIWAAHQRQQQQQAQQHQQQKALRQLDTVLGPGSPAADGGWAQTQAQARLPCCRAGVRM
jgi:hypothetical protein